MKIKAKWTIGKMIVARRALAPALLVFVIASAAAARAANAQSRTVPPEKGAAGLMVRAQPERLPSEAENPNLIPLIEGWQRLAPELLRIRTERSNQVAHLAIHRIRQAPDRPVLLFLHGVLSDHETWQYVAAALASDYELWLVDLPGCGDSEVLKVSVAESDSYSLTAMGERVLQAMGESLAEVAPGRQITLVGHSLGGSVVIRMVSSPDLQTRYDAVLKRVDHAVLLAPCDLAVNSVPTKFITVLGLKHWMLGVGNVLGVTDSKLREATRAGYQRPECATVEQEWRFAHNVKDSKHLKATQWMLKSAVPFDKKTLRPKWNEIDRLTADYARVHIPVLIAFGEWDETLAASMGNKLKDEIPGAWLVKMPGRGHALPTEDPDVCAQLIRWFQQGKAMDQFTGSSVKIYRPGNIPDRLSQADGETGLAIATACSQKDSSLPSQMQRL
jgi:pimeloyl-ACP methyl ester carboxylesterase